MVLAVEEAVVLDIFVSGIDHIERLEGGLVRVVLYVERREPDGSQTRVVVAKLIRPIATLPHSMKMMARALSDAPFVTDLVSLNS